MNLFGTDKKTNPYAEAEERIHHNMKGAEAGDADETFVRKMIEHHRGALEMGQLHHQHGSDPELHAMVSRSAQEQEKEIAELRSWLSRRSGSSQ